MTRASAGATPNAETSPNATDRRRAALAREASFHAALLAQIDDAVVAVDRHQRVLFWNAAAERQYGYSADKAIGRSYGDLVGSHVTKPERHAIFESMRVAGSWSGGASHFGRQCRAIDVSIRASIVTAPDGSGVFLATLRDVTAHAELARAADQRRRRLEAMHALERAIIELDEPLAIAQAIARTTREVTGSHLAGVAEFDSTGELEFVAVDGESRILTAGARTTVTDLPLERFRAGQSIVIDDLAAFPDPFAAVLATEGWRAAVLVPMAIEAGLTGVLGILWRNPRTSSFDLEAVTEMATAAAIGLRQQRLHASAVSRATALEAVHAAAGELQAVGPTAELGTRAIAVLERVAGFDHCAILLVDTASGRLQPFAISDQGHPGDARFVEADRAALEAHHLRLGWGITGWVAEHGESVRLADASADPRYLAVRQGIRSELCVPIQSGDRVVGVINVESTRADRYSEEDQLILETIASQFAVALANARLIDDLQGNVEDLQRATRRLSSVASIGDLALRNLSLDDLIDQLLNEVREALASDSATILLLEADGHELAVRASAGAETDVIAGARIPMGEGFAGRIAETGEPLVIDDTAGFHFVFPYLQAAASSLAGVPLRVAGRTIGVLHVGSRTPRRYSPDDVRLLDVVADRAAAAIERAQLEEALRLHASELEARVASRTQELTEINAELDTFSYTMSHDLKAPLRAMRGFAEALLEDETQRLSDDGRDHAARIVAAAERMDRLIEDLLAYARLARADLSLTSVSLDDVVATVVEHLVPRGQLAAAPISVAPRLGRVRVNQQALVQVVANLLGNAVKYVPDGVTPMVRVRAEAVAGGRRRLWIEDNGLGIAPEHQERVFRPFERLHGIEAYPGTGIGLAIVRKAVERMGGSCGVDSELGRGSRFWIELPSARGRRR